MRFTSFAGDGGGCGCCEPTPDCNACAFGAPASLTDVNATITFFRTSTSPYTWQGAYYLTTTSVGVIDIDGLGSCFANMPTSSGPIVICYIAVCNVDGTLTVTRQWYRVQQRLTSNWFYVQNSSTPAPTSGNPCPLDYGGFFCTAGRVVADSAGATSNLSDCSPPAWSGTLTAAGTNLTADPVGGRVSIS